MISRITTSLSITIAIATQTSAMASTITCLPGQVSSGPVTQKMKPRSPGADVYTVGLHHFHSKRYNQAVYHLKHAIEKDPYNALAHYYLGSSLVYLKRHKEAITAYRRSYELEPYGIVSGFCRQALLTYNVAIPVVGLKKKPKLIQEADEPVDLDEALEDAEEDAKDTARNATPHFDQARAMIRRQLEDEKARKKSYADRLADKEVKVGEAKAKVIRDEAEETIREMYEGPVFYDSQGVARVRGAPAWRLHPMMQEVIRQRAEQIRRDAEAKAELEKSIANERSSQFKQWAIDRQQDLEFVADNLETQLLSVPGRSGILLNPVGTGLYVRNYKTFQPKNPLPEAHQSILRFVDRGYSDDEPDALTTPNNRLGPKREVSGKVLH